MSFNHSCLVTVIKNTSGGKLGCSFLPPHGRTLDVDEEVEVAGNIIEAIRHMHRTASDRMINSFLAALDSGDLSIVSCPTPILEDEVTGHSRILAIHNNVLKSYGPCWESVAS